MSGGGDGDGCPKALPGPSNLPPVWPGSSASGFALLELHVVMETGTLSYGGVSRGGVLRPNVDEKMKRGMGRL